MPRRKNKARGAPSDKTIPEMKQWYEQNKNKLQWYAQANDALRNLRDVTKNSSKTIKSFSKDSLRTYLKNIGSNEKNLRSLSRYLYYRSQVYYRLISYNANMFDLSARSVIPSYSLTEENNKEDIIKSYYETLKILDKLNLQYEFLKIYTTCFREDVFYGCVYFDEKAKTSQSMFILPIDPDYCKIQGVYSTGDFSFAMDMSYFKNKQDILEFWGEPFKSMYTAYTSKGMKWQTMPEKYAVCLKARAEDWETVVPVFSGLLNSLINLLDLEDIQAIADEQQIYKLIWLEMETLTGSSNPDDWKVNPDIMIQYFNRMTEEALPEYSSAAIIPGKLNTISFDNDQATDTSKIEKATETVLNTSGGAQVLNSASVKGTTAFNAAMKSDSEFAVSMLLPQTEAWLNRFLSYYVKNPAKVKFFEVSAYTKQEFKKSLMESSTYGFPNKLALNTLNGFSELDTLAMNFLEEECLGLTDKFVPLKSSHTTSSDALSDKKSGGQEKDADELTDDGEASKDKKDNSNG